MKPLSAQQLLVFIIFFFGCEKEAIYYDKGASFSYNAETIAPGLMLGQVYNTNNFAAFTDITNYNNNWYIVFRVGSQHVGGLNGVIKILKSADAVTWTVQQIISNDSLDLRDSKFVIDSVENNLYINYTGVKYTQNGTKIYGFLTTYNPATQNWSNSQIITYDNNEAQFWFWRFTYSNKKMFSAAYHVPILGGYTNDDICLFSNAMDFKAYKTIGKLNLGQSPNETTVRVDSSGRMFFLIRRETAPVALGYSDPSDYSKVTWINSPLSMKLSSPNFLFYKNKLLICGRDQDQLTFNFFSYNLLTNKIEKKFTFPSGIETGYGGMSFNPANSDELYISYYVITNKQTYIYLAKMDLKTFLQ